jgi:hypothetical protein
VHPYCLQDSWRRAYAFRGQYEALRRCGRCDGIGLTPGQQLGGVSLQPLVDEVSAVCIFINSGVVGGVVALGYHLGSSWVVCHCSP